jgi:hypothetical protein
MFHRQAKRLCGLTDVIFYHQRQRYGASISISRAVKVAGVVVAGARSGHPALKGVVSEIDSADVALPVRA